MNETRTLASWTAGLRVADLPLDVREHAKRFILDNLGCQIAGATLPWSRSYYEAIKATRSGTHATVAYFGDKLSPDDAAFVNSAFNHANETDDTHLKSHTHPGGVAIPSALAMAQYAHADGARLLAAVVASYEIQIRLAWACEPALINRGHHPAVGVGPFGAAAAGAIVMGFDAEQTLQSFGIAGSHSAGLMEFVRAGGAVKRIHSAIPAAAGVRAVLFANAGITGPQSIIEGEKGFCKVFAGDYDINRLTDALGSQYHLLENALKPYSCCHLIHPTLDALDLLREDGTLAPDQVSQITVYTNNQAVLGHIGSTLEPKDVLGAQFSVPFSVAMRLHHGGRGVHGGNGYWDYPSIDINDHRLLATARKVKCVVVNDARWASVDKGAGVEIVTTDGRCLRKIVPYSKGRSENPMSTDDVVEKFLALVGPLMPDERPAQIIDTVFKIERLKDIEELAQLLVVPILE